MVSWRQHKTGRRVKKFLESLGRSPAPKKKTYLGFLKIIGLQSLFRVLLFVDLVIVLLTKYDDTILKRRKVVHTLSS
jgi:hypothetical protein